MRDKFFILLIVVILSSFIVTANEKYSFENAERLKPLIEWRDFGPKSFEEARDENKPIFLLLTAPSWCYWCQVYESEDYLFNPEVVEIINSKFIPIYVNADERQDLTREYLEGGWPSTTVMTPLGDRIYGFSGVRPIPQMIQNLNEAVLYVATTNLDSEFSYGYEKTSVRIPTDAEISSVRNSYLEYNYNTYDSLHGGFGEGQKFPQAHTLNHFLEVYEETGDERLLEAVRFTLTNQYTSIDELDSNYNLYDPVEGGFHRYGVSRDWSPPHYEKMLYDNARLLRAYYHLLKVDPENEIAKEVVDGTLKYIEINYYDSFLGGFYANTDVNGEEAYYSLNPRPVPGSRVELTKFTDWNSEAILTYLYLYEETGEEKYRIIAEKSLNFFTSEMIGSDGAYHYLNEKGEKGVRGTIFDNSYLTLALIEGYRVLGNEDYLSSAINLAEYQKENLYDWNSGGFFERNSPDLELYASGENIRLIKPSTENGVAAYAFILLYKETLNPSYLLVSFRTIGYGLERTGGNDRGYYMIKALNEFSSNNYVSKYFEIEEELLLIENVERENFWLDAVLEREFDFNFSGDPLEGPLLVLMIISLFAGFLSFISPCSLPILPAFVAYSIKSSHKNIKGMNFSFFLGLISVFTFLGMASTFVGSFLKDNLEIFSELSGILIIFVGLYILSGRGIPTFKIANKVPSDYLGAFIFGAILALAWSPCVGPILVAILILASTSTSYLSGGLLLASYGIGLSIPLIYFSSYLSKKKNKGAFWKLIKGRELAFEFTDTFKPRIHSTTLISGLLFIILGYLIFSGKLFIFNQYIGGTSFQAYVFGAEEWILSFIR